MKILVAGAGGLVGMAVTNHCRAISDVVLPHKRESLDITDPEQTERVIAGEKPDAVINCAAWTDVDGCELDQQRAFKENANGPENLAAACRGVNAALVTISTDYVFDGTKQGFYTQLDEPNPKSVYGLSKLEGERRVQQVLPNVIVARTGFVFGEGGKNFLSTIIQRARLGQKLKVITDARGTPTYAVDLAIRLRELAALASRGTQEFLFHVVNSGSGVSYEEFARQALQTAGLDAALLEPVTVASLNRPAPRPANSSMSCIASERVGLPPLPDWQEALGRFASKAVVEERVPA